MPRQNSNTPIVVFALIISIALVAFLAWAFFAPPQQQTPPTNETPDEKVLTETTATPVPPSDLTPPQPPATKKITTPEPPGETPTPVPSPTASPTPNPTETPTPVPSPSPSPKATPTPDNTFSLSGFVNDSLGAPAPNVSLYIVPKISDRFRYDVRKGFEEGSTRWIATTDDEGGYQIKLPANQEYITGLIIDGEPQPFAQSIPKQDPGELISTDFSLPRPMEVRGLVTDLDKNPVPGITIDLSWQTATILQQDKSIDQITLQTDSTGRYVHRIFEPARVTVEIDKEKLPTPYLYDKGAVTLQRDDFGNSGMYRVDFNVSKGVEVNGVVQVQNGDGLQTVSNSKVTLLEQADPYANRKAHEYTTRTDEQGNFQFPSVYPLVYDIKAEHPDYHENILVGFDSSRENPAVVELKPFAHIAGTVQFSPSSPVDQITVSLANRTNKQVLPVTESTPGVYPFQFDKIAPGMYYLFAEWVDQQNKVWYDQKRITVYAGNSLDNETLSLKPLTEVSGQLIAIDDRTPSFQQLSIKAYPRGGEKKLDESYLDISAGSKWLRAPIASSSDTGEFTLEGLANNQEYLVVISDRKTQKEWGSVLVRGGTDKNYEVPLNGTGKVFGMVRNGQGELCVGTKVILVANLGNQSGTPQHHEAVVAFDGYYTFDHLPAGPGRLQLENDDTTMRLISVVEDEELEIGLKCRTYVNVNFTIKTAQATPLKNGEQLLITPKEGTNPKKRVVEISYPNLTVEMEPGKYIMTRTSTMKSKSFEVIKYMTNEITVDFAGE